MLPQAFEPLLHACVGDTVRRVCRGWLRADAEDISQATRLRLVRHAHERPSTQLTPAYVRRAARNGMVDALRRQQRREALTSVARAATASALGPRDPETELLGRELVTTVREALERLPPARRQAVLLYLDGHGVVEIAERLGCTRKRCDNLVYRGLASLRGELRARGVSSAWTHA